MKERDLFSDEEMHSPSSHKEEMIKKEPFQMIRKKDASCEDRKRKRPLTCDNEEKNSTFSNKRKWTSIMIDNFRY